MGQDKKQPYNVESPIKHNGKYYKPGATIKLTAKEAERLRVTEIEKAEVVDPDKIDPVSTSLNAGDAIAYIEEASPEDLEGFLAEDEERKTVIAAWEEKFDS